MTRSKIGSRLGVATIALLSAAIIMSCDPMGEIRKMDLGDITPPILNSHVVQDLGIVTLEFDEEVSLQAGSLRLNSCDEQIGVHPLAADESFSRQICLQIDGQSLPGKQYSLELVVEDKHQNSLSIVMPFYGPNPQAAQLLINEILTSISSKNRDTLELWAQRGGNIGGITIFWGLPGDFDYAWSLPALEIQAGDYLLIHCKPENLPEEIMELSDILASGGKNSSPLARDFWLFDAPGLPDSSGIISLADNPLGKIRDAVFYSDKITISGKDYRSFGTKKLLDRAEILQGSNVWKVSGELIMVEDAAQTGSLTATRSINRRADHGDTDSAADWHVVPSGQTSLGSANNDEIYIKP